MTKTRKERGEPGLSVCERGLIGDQDTAGGHDVPALTAILG